MGTIANQVMADEAEYGAGESNLFTLQDAWDKMGADSYTASTAEWNDAKVMTYRTAKKLLDGDTPTMQESLRLQCEITGNHDAALAAWADTLDRMEDKDWEGEIAHLVVKEGATMLMSERLATWERDYNERVVERFQQLEQGELF